MFISKTTKAAIFVCCATIFTSPAFAQSAGVYKIEAEYKRLDFSDRGVDVKLSQISDKIIYTIEVKNEQLEVVTNILDIHDAKTTYLEDMKPDFTLGNCHGTQTAVGQYEAFKLNQAVVQAVVVRESVQLPNIPKPPGTPGHAPGYPQGRPTYQISAVLSGIEHLRGWNFSGSCNLVNIAETDVQVIDTTLEFNSKDLKTAGQTLVIDKTENGFGWVFTISRQ